MISTSSSASQLAAALGKWIGVFMRQSMGELVQYAKESGLSMSQISALFRLYHTGACPISEIGAHLGFTNAAASQMVERLVRQGLLERVEDLQDRRVKRLSLTPAGRQLVENGMQVRRRWMEQLSASIPSEQREAVGSALNLLTDAALRLEDLHKEN
jgi:DNA-binding MarR family transcriptional regulator